MNRIFEIVKPITVFFLVILLLPLIIIYFIKEFIYGLWLKHRFRKKFVTKGKNILFIYSGSPNWQEYIETHIIPSISERSVFLNWSERNRWDKREPLEAKVLRHWGGSREFNPMAIIFLPNGKVKTVRFFKAFKDFKHGKKKLLEKTEKELYEYLKI